MSAFLSAPGEPVPALHVSPGRGDDSGPPKKGRRQGGGGGQSGGTVSAQETAAYVAHLLKSLDPLLHHPELREVRFMIAMAAQESSDCLKRLEDGEPGEGEK